MINNFYKIKNNTLIEIDEKQNETPPVVPKHKEACMKNKIMMTAMMMVIIK